MSLTIDLTEDAAFFRVLLSDTLAWRERLVERFIFGSGNHVRVTSSFQCEIPPDLVRPFLPAGDQVSAIKALVPITTRDKQPLLAFELQGPCGRASLLRKSDIAALEAGYVAEAISTSQANAALVDGIGDDLAEAICAFSPGLYERIRNDRRQSSSSLGARAEAVAEYLSYGLNLAIRPATVEEWLKESDRAKRALVEVLDEPEREDSSSECVLLALPLMESPPSSSAEVESTVARYVEGVEAAARSDDLAVLQALADYGRRWELVAEMELPLGEPWVVKIAEDRPLNWDRGSSRQVIALGDAKSVHFELTVTDPSLSLREGSHRITTLAGGELNFGDVEDIRETAETLAIYSGQTGREVYYASLRVAFGRPFYVRLAHWLVVVLVLGSVAIAALVDGTSIAEELAVIAVPTTFAATLLLVRESTTLAARVDRTLRTAVAAATVTLWLVVAARLLGEGSVL